MAKQDEILAEEIRTTMMAKGTLSYGHMELKNEYLFSEPATNDF